MLSHKLLTITGACSNNLGNAFKIPWAIARIILIAASIKAGRLSSIDCTKFKIPSTITGIKVGRDSVKLFINVIVICNAASAIVGKVSTRKVTKPTIRSPAKLANAGAFSVMTIISALIS